MKSIILFLSLISISSSLLSQETRYIRDELYVPLRSGQGSQFRIVHKGLASGTQLTVLEESEDGKYTKVATTRGKEGWLQSQYLMKQPAGRDLYEQALKTIAKLETQSQELKKQLTEKSNESKQMAQQLSNTNTTNSTISKELSNVKKISANAIQLNTDNQVLLEENQALKNEVDVLSTDKKRLQDDQSNEAFLNGALSVIIGVMIALIVPRLWPKKKDNW